MRAGYGKSLRGYFAEKDLLLLIDLGSDVFETATVDTNILMVANRPNRQGLRAVTISKDDLDWIADAVSKKSANLPISGEGPVFIGSSAELALKEKIERTGRPLKDWGIQINYGIKTGLNEAFVIDRQTRDRLIAEDPKSAEIIKPMLRGRDVKRYGYEFSELYLILVKYGFSDELFRYPAIHKHLKSFEPQLRAR